MNLDAALSDKGRLHLRPLIDGLTALHVGCSEPVGTGVLWAGVRTGLQPIVPVLFENGVRSVTDILPNTAPLLEAGLQAWQLEAVILGCIEVLPSLPKERVDHPKVRPRKRASWATALEAAQPGKRQAALDALQADVLAFTTKASTDSRVRSWQELCRAWGRSPFPVNVDNVKGPA
eukprot:s573_g26.t1